MKKAILLLALAINTHAFAQTSDYRTAEDGINQLINNVDFLEKMSHMSNEQIANTTLNSLLDEYVPEYKGFKVDLKNLNTGNIYYGNAGNVSSQKLSGSLGQLLGLNSQETADLQSLFSNDYSGTSYLNKITNSNLGSQLEQVVNNPASYLKSELHQAVGGGEAAGSLINLGFNWLARQEEDLARSEQAEQARAAAKAAREKAARDYKNGQDNILNRALLKINNAYENVWDRKYDEAIMGYTDAIAILRTAHAAGYEIMQAFNSRGRAKLGKGDSRGAIIDYYFALNTYSDIEAGKLKSGNPDFMSVDKIRIIRNRAYAKYLSGDYNGCIADCNLGLNTLSAKYAKYFDWNSGITIATGNLKNDDFSFMLSTEQAVVENYFAILATIEVAKKQHEQAEKYWKFVTDFTPEKSDYSYGKANVYFKGLPSFFTYQSFLVKAHSYHELKNWLKEIGVYNYLISIKPKLIRELGIDATSLYLKRALAWQELNYKDKALEDLNKAIELKPSEAIYYSARAVCKTSMGDLEGAAKDNEFAKDPLAAAASAKRTKDYYYNKAIEFQSRKDAIGELKVYAEALREYPDENTLVINSAEIIRKIHTKDIALELSTIVKGNEPGANLFKAIYFNLLGDKEQALNYHIKALEGSPFLHEREQKHLKEYDLIPLYCKYAMSLIKLQLSRYPQSYKTIVDSYTKDADKVYLYEMIANAYFEIGDANNAILYADKEIKGEGKSVYVKDFDSDIIVTKVKSLLYLGRNKEAVACAKKFAIPQKHYEIKSDDENIAFIKSIAADYCGYDTK